MFVLSISAFYLIKGRHTELAKRSMTVAASFGLAAALSVRRQKPEDENRRD